MYVEMFSNCPCVNLQPPLHMMTKSSLYGATALEVILHSLLICCKKNLLSVITSGEGFCLQLIKEQSHTELATVSLS